MRQKMMRSDLYKLVWSSPVTKVAQELGISDVGLSKLCARYGIPTPPRGYWAKFAVGHKLPRTRMPSPTRDFSITLPVRSQPEAVPEGESQLAEVAKLTNLLADVLEDVKSRTEAVHPIIKSTRAYLEKIPILQRRYDRLLARNRLPRSIDLPFLHKGVRQFNSSKAIGMLVSDRSIEWALRKMGVIETYPITYANGGKATAGFISIDGGDSAFFHLTDFFSAGIRPQVGQRVNFGIAAGRPKERCSPVLLLKTPTRSTAESAP